MTKIHELYPGQWGPPAIVQDAEEHDRKEFAALVNKENVATRDIAQWLLDHDKYPAEVVGRWAGRSERWAGTLRKWAREGFVGAPFNSRGLQQARDRHQAHRDADASLKTKDNFTDTPKPDEDDDEDDIGGVEDPAAIVSNVLDSISGAKSLFEAWRKTFNASAFNREQKAQLHNAIELLITKLRKVQSTLDTKGRGHA